LEGAGYEVRTFNIPAAGVGAPHRRERMWIVANRKESMVNPDNVRLEQHNTAKEETSWWRTSTTFEPTGDVENSRRSIRGEQSSRHQESIGPGTSEKTEWSTNSDSTTRSSEGETIMANANSGRSHEQNNEIQTGRNIPISSSEDVADTESSLGNDIQAVAGTSESTTQEVSGNGSRIRGESAWWDFEPNVGRVAHGVPGRVYRLKGLGNSIIPQIAQEIGNAIIKAEGEE